MKLNDQVMSIRSVTSKPLVIRHGWVNTVEHFSRGTILHCVRSGCLWPVSQIIKFSQCGKLTWCVRLMVMLLVPACWTKAEIPWCKEANCRAMAGHVLGAMQGPLSLSRTHKQHHWVRNWRRWRPDVNRLTVTEPPQASAQLMSSC